MHRPQPPTYYRPWTSLRPSAGPLLGLGIAIPGPMTGLGLLLEPPPGVPPLTNGTGPSAGLRTSTNGRDFGTEMLTRWRDTGLSARVMDREPTWVSMHPPVEDTFVPVAKPFPWLLYGGIGLGVLLVGRALLKKKSK